MRFKAGDSALLVVAHHPEDYPFLGEIVTILKVGPFPPGTDFSWLADGVCVQHTVDYLVVCGNHAGLVMDWQLRPLNDPDEPIALTRIEELEHAL